MENTAQSTPQLKLDPWVVQGPNGHTVKMASGKVTEREFVTWVLPAISARMAELTGIELGKIA